MLYTLFRLIRYSGGIYLIYLGWQLWKVRVRKNMADGENTHKDSFFSTKKFFLAGNLAKVINIMGAIVLVLVGLYLLISS